MKKYVLVLAFCSCVFSLFAQRGFYGWFHMGVDGALGTSYMLHPNMLKDENVELKVFNPSYLAGYEFGVTVSNLIELSFEGNQHNVVQNFNVFGDNFNVQQVYRVNYIENAGFIRYLGAQGYFEVGYARAMFESADAEHAIISNNTGSTINIFDHEAIGKFETNHNSLLVGFGITPWQYEVFELDMGIRAKYSFNSITQTDMLSLANNAIYPNGSPYAYAKPTNALSILVQVELKYYFGFFGRALCGSRGVLLFKKPKKFSLQ